MKQRIMSGAVGLAFFLIAIIFRKRIIFNLAMSALSVAALWELFNAAKYTKNKLLVGTCFAFAAVVPFAIGVPVLDNFPISLSSGVICFGLLLGLFGIMLYKHKKIKFEQVAVCFMMTLAISYAFTSLVLLRDLPYKYPNSYNEIDSLFFIILATFGAWVPDIGAYFFGYFFGKHKLSPEISPKKTIEGAIGGLICNFVFFIAIGIGFQAYTNHVYSGIQQTDINLVAMGILSIVCTLASILGDLSASFIKRSCNIKDFGNVLPGHGGVLDRFDSYLLVAPIILLTFEFCEIFQRSFV